MKPKPQSRQSDAYEQFILHQRKVIRLHFNLDLPLYPFCFEHEIRRKSAWFDAPPCPFAMLVLMEEGENLYRLNGREFRVKPGKILFVPEFVPFYFSSSGYCHKYILELKGCHMTSICSSLQLEKPEFFDFGEDLRFQEALKALGNAVECTDSEQFAGLMAETYRLLAWLALHRSAHTPKPTLLPRVLEFLEQELEQQIPIAKLCERTGLNKATLTRMVKRGHRHDTDAVSLATPDRTRHLFPSDARHNDERDRLPARLLQSILFLRGIQAHYRQDTYRLPHSPKNPSPPKMNPSPRSCAGFFCQLVKRYY